MSFNIGDQVDLIKCYDGIIRTFTVEMVGQDGWVWGSDLPQPYYYEGHTEQKHINWHNPDPTFMRLSKTITPSRILKPLTL